MGQGRPVARGNALVQLLAMRPTDEALATEDVAPALVPLARLQDGLGRL
jgi:hypothetical protein